MKCSLCPSWTRLWTLAFAVDAFDSTGALDARATIFCRQNGVIWKKEKMGVFLVMTKITFVPVVRDFSVNTDP